MNKWLLRAGVLGVGLAIGFAALLMRSSSAVAVQTREPWTQQLSKLLSASRPISSMAAASGAEANGASLRILVVADGKPVPDAAVTLLHEETHKQLDFTTQADGTQRILSLPSGDYDLGVCQPGFLFVSLHHRQEAGSAQEVTVTLTRGARLEGKVVDSSGRPVKGAVVMLQEPRVGGPIAHDLAAQTDASGQYLIEGVPQGHFDVRFRHDQHRSWTFPGLTVSAPGQSFTINAVLEEGRRLSGRVVNEEREPVAGATVVASNGEVVAARTDREGRFTLQGLGDQPVYCYASAQGYGVAFHRAVPPGSADLEFRLPGTTTVSGQIEGPYVPDRFIVRLSLFEPSQARYLPLYSKDVEGAAGGEFHLVGVSPGRYRLEVQADGFVSDELPELTLVSGRPVSGLQVRLRKSP